MHIAGYRATTGRSDLVVIEWVDGVRLDEDLASRSMSLLDSRSTRTLLTCLTLASILALAGCASSPTEVVAGEVAVTSSMVPVTSDDDVERDDDDEIVVPSTVPLLPGEVGQVQCDSRGLCAEEFELDGQIYALSCVAVLEEAVTSVQIGAGDAFESTVVVHEVVGFDRTEIVAISIPGGFCSEDPNADISTPWSFAFETRLDPARVTQAACEIVAVSPTRRATEGCN